MTCNPKCKDIWPTSSDIKGSVPPLRVKLYQAEIETSKQKRVVVYLQRNSAEESKAELSMFPLTFQTIMRTPSHLPARSRLGAWGIKGRCCSRHTKMICGYTQTLPHTCQKHMYNSGLDDWLDSGRRQGWQHLCLLNDQGNRSSGRELRDCRCGRGLGDISCCIHWNK